VFFLSLTGTELDRHSRLLIAWFGPRGLSSLLLILIPVFAGVPGTQPLFVICCLVVLLSVGLHGSSLMLLGRVSKDSVMRKQQAPISGNLMAATSAGSDTEGLPAATVQNDGDLMSVEELRKLQSTGAPVLVVDVRAETSFNSSTFQAQGALRIPPDQAVRRITELNIPRHSWIVAFCA
jgi:NhaP-type Na+/H+ and K+/H+ antiporter